MLELVETSAGQELKKRSHDKVLARTGLTGHCQLLPASFSPFRSVKPEGNLDHAAYRSVNTGSLLSLTHNVEHE